MNEDCLLCLTTHLQKVVGLLSSLSPLHLCQMWLKSADDCSRLHGDNTARDNVGFFSLWSTAKDKAEKKRQKGTQPKGSGETTRNQPSLEASVTGPTPTTTRSSQRTPANSERESLGKEKPTKDSLRRGERGFKHVLLLLPHCFL